MLATEPLSGATASFTTSSLSLGGHDISAIYSGDPDFLPSTSADSTQQVNSLSTTNLQSAINSAKLGEPGHPLGIRYQLAHQHARCDLEPAIRCHRSGIRESWKWGSLPAVG